VEITVKLPVMTILVILKQDKLGVVEVSKINQKMKIEEE
jgi:hypothetical protein